MTKPMSKREQDRQSFIDKWHAHGGIAADACALLREANGESVLLKAERDGLASQLLSVQQECILWRQRYERAENNAIGLASKVLEKEKEWERLMDKSAILAKENTRLRDLMIEVRKWMDKDEFGPWETALCTAIDEVLK